MRRISFIACLFVVLVVAVPSFAEPHDAVQTNLYFGLALDAGGEVSEEEWSAFLAEEVTLRFPDGFTVIDAYGQWRDPSLADAPIIREKTKLLIIVHPGTAETDRAITEIKSLYKRRFDQKSVFHTDASVRIVE
ncbi:MAG: DUF3574 domain-containing protein [Parvibaculaceae bacterium]|nr:DUF3574 domain-containing protein [Parvibaculaceae bacterium]